MRLSSKIFFLLLLSFVSVYNSYAQTEEKAKDQPVDQKIENIAETQENEDLDYTTLLDQLNFYIANPIDLNNTTPELLSELHLLNDIQINNLIQHIEQNGKLISIYELQSIDGFDVPTIRKILPYVKVSDSFGIPYYSFKEALANGKHQFIFRVQQIVEEQKGFIEDTAALRKNPNSKYLGSPQKLYARYRFNYANNLSWGVTGEKDAGEEFFKGTQKNGFDFYSAHFYIAQKKYIKALAIGDYQVSFGQGLTAWSGLAFGKSPDAINIKKTGTGIRPYTSVNENLFLRGAAVTTAIKDLSFTAFASRKKADANVSAIDTLTGEILEISSLQQSGFHTIPSEIENKNVVTQQVMGGNINLKKRNFSVGLTAINGDVDSEIKPSSSYYNQFTRLKNHYFNIGSDYNLIFSNFNIFGEISKSENGGIAYLNGALISIDPKLSLSILNRNYQKEYTALFGNGFGENSIPNNEKGTYTGFVFKPVSMITINGYYDQFRFPWLRFRVNAPSYGYDYLGQMTYTPSKKSEFYFRFRKRQKMQNVDIPGVEITYPANVNSTSYRINSSFDVSPSVKLKNRFEYLLYKPANLSTQRGYIIYQDVVYTALGSPISLTLRYLLFHTDDYNTRIYTYENDVPGSYSIPAFYDRGLRWYGMINYSVNRNLDLWLRYSRTTYSDKKEISEGSLSEIQGNSKSEIKVQAVLRF